MALRRFRVGFARLLDRNAAMRRSRGSGCGSGGLGLFSFGKCEPIFWRKGDTPGVSGRFQFQSDLEELTDRARALNPGNTAAHSARRLTAFGVGYFQSDPHILEHVMFGLVAAAMAIDDERRSAFVEGAAQGVHTGHN